MKKWHMSFVAALFLPMTGVQADAVKVFILAGQSNMEGHGKVEMGYDPAGSGKEVKGGIGCLRTEAKKNKDMAKWIAADGSIVVRDDVWVVNTIGKGQKGRLTTGFGKGPWFGPELGFGQVIGDAFDEPVLLIKTAWGGHDLGVKFRPPSSGTPTYQKAKFKPDDVGSSYRKMMEVVKDVTGNLATHFPELKGRKVEFVGFGWHQGWNDGCSDEMTAEYEKNMVNFIKDVRKELGVKDLPFVIANTGQNGPATKGRFATLCETQMAIGDPKKHPEFKGTVASVDTRPFKRTREQSPKRVWLPLEPQW